MKVLTARDPDFKDKWEEVLLRKRGDMSRIEEEVRSILKDVQVYGDQALFDYTHRFEEVWLDAATVRVSDREFDEALGQVDREGTNTLELAAKRIERFHARQIRQSWSISEEEGEHLGQVVRPLERVGVYVPGGKAAYPSSVLMNTIPAKLAGVPEVIMVSPSLKGRINPYVLAAARIAGVSHIYKVGGAQAIAALAYGTEAIPRVDKIVGPGGIYVEIAKKLVFGEVGIDMVAGPSEILIVSDGSGSPAYAAADLLSQAEHDELAFPILVTQDAEFIEKVEEELSRQVEQLNRKDIAKRSLEERGTIVLTEDVEESIALANQFAPEHLELAVDDPFSWVDRVRSAGAVFLGHYTPEAVGDYVAGPNHVLPTGGTARFLSPLSVDDFVKKMSVIFFSREALKKVGSHITRLAYMEGLEAHARAVEKRLEAEHRNT